MRWSGGAYEVLRFGVKQAWACLFGGALLERWMAGGGEPVTPSGVGTVSEIVRAADRGTLVRRLMRSPDDVPAPGPSSRALAAE